MKKITDDELLELYRQGKTNREIADVLKVSQAAVHYRIESLGLMNNHQKKGEINPQQVRLLHRMGLTTVGIALLLKTNVVVVSKTMKDMGLEDNYFELRKIIYQTPWDV